MTPNEVNPPKKVNPAIISVIVIAIIALSSGAIYAATRSDTAASSTVASTDTTSGQSSSTNSSADTSTSSSSASTASSSYKDGSYTETQSYRTPEGREEITVTTTLSNGVITAVSIQNSGYDRESREYQQAFAASYESYVVGKSIDSLQLSRIAGASLTTDGFNSAIETIKNDARG